MKSGDMKEGEYRSHLYFRAEKNNQPLGQENKVIDTTTISIKLEAVFGISIACIIRKGVSTAEASISHVAYTEDKEGNAFLNLNLNRTGNMSVYGDFSVVYQKDNKAVEVAKIKGVAVYTPGLLRKVKLKLDKTEQQNFSGGSFKIIYTQNESKKILAETEWKM